MTPKGLCALASPGSPPWSVESVRARTRSGRLAPMAVVGMSISTNAMPRRRGLSTAGWSRKGRKIGAKRCGSEGNSSTRVMPQRAMAVSSSAYSRRGLVVLDASRMLIPLPMASPPMKLASTMLPAQTLLPKVRPASRNHSVSNRSAAPPDTKKMPQSACSRRAAAREGCVIVRSLPERAYGLRLRSPLARKRRASL